MPLTKVTYSMIKDAAVNVTDYGASSSASAATNLAAFKAAVAATPVGGTVLIPATGSPFIIDTSGGEAAAILIDKELTIYLEGDVKCSTASITTHPTIFNITANNVTLTGTGSIIGDGQTDQTNVGGLTATGLVKVTGDYFRMSGITIDTPYKIGVNIRGSDESSITECKFTGGPTTYLDTAYFGVLVYNSSRTIISNNHFYPSATGGMFCQCIFGGGSCNYSVIEGNTAFRPYEKLVYIYGNDNLITNNMVTGNTGAIPGTNTVGTLTTVYRVNGSRNMITNNYSRYGGGATAMDGIGNIISNNTFYDCGQGGISIFGSASVLYDYTTVEGNVITCGNLSGVIIQDGILINAPSGTNRYIDVTDNTVFGFSPSNPLVNIPAWQANHAYGKYTIIQPTTPNGYWYTCNSNYTGGVAGTSGSTEPIWPTTVDATVTDGSVTWVCQQVYSPSTTAQIRVLSSSALADRCQILDNNVAGGMRGIVTQYMTNSTISGNRILATQYGISEYNGSYNRYRYNTVEGTLYAGIYGMDSNSRGAGNSYNNTDLVTEMTMNAGSPTTTSTFVYCAPEAQFLVSPSNAAACALVKNKGGVYATRVGVDFTLTVGDGTNAVGTEKFQVQVIQ